MIDDRDRSLDARSIRGVDGGAVGTAKAVVCTGTPELQLHWRGDAEQSSVTIRLPCGADRLDVTMTYAAALELLSRLERQSIDNMTEGLRRNRRSTDPRPDDPAPPGADSAP